MPVLVPVAALLATMLSVQVGAAVAKSLFVSAGAEGTNTLRLGISAVILALVLRPWRAKVARRDWPVLAVYGAAIGGMNLFFYMALERIPLGITAALEFTGPLSVAVAFSRRRLDLVWVGMAALGLILLLPLGITPDRLDPAGIALALGGAACWAIYILAGKKAGARYGSTAVAIGMIVGAIIVGPSGTAGAYRALGEPGIAFTALWVAILSSALPFALEMYALRHLPAQTYGTLISTEPAIGALIGFVFLHEALSLVQCLAIALIITASVGTTLTLRTHERAAGAYPLPEG